MTALLWMHFAEGGYATVDHRGVRWKVRPLGITQSLAEGHEWEIVQAGERIAGAATGAEAREYVERAVRREV